MCKGVNIYFRTNSDLCHLQYKLIGFITEMKSVYSAVRTGSLNIAVCASSVKVLFKQPYIHVHVCTMGDTLDTEI